MSAAFHLASSQAKLKACWSSSGRTYAEVRPASASTPRPRPSGRRRSRRGAGASRGRPRGPRAGPTSARPWCRSRAATRHASSWARSSLVDFLVAQLAVLEQSVGDVHPEAVDAAVEPEPQHALEHLAHLGVAPVQVGLGAVEDVEVPLCRSVGPSSTRSHAMPPKIEFQLFGGCLPAAAFALAEHVAVALGAAGAGGQRLLEPLVLVGGVVGHQVDDDLEAERVRLLEQGVGVGEVAEPRVDVDVVGHVVARRRAAGSGRTA